MRNLIIVSACLCLAVATNLLHQCSQAVPISDKQTTLATNLTTTSQAQLDCANQVGQSMISFMIPEDLRPGIELVDRSFSSLAELANEVHHDEAFLKQAGRLYNNNESCRLILHLYLHLATAVPCCVDMNLIDGVHLVELLAQNYPKAIDVFKVVTVCEAAQDALTLRAD